MDEQTFMTVVEENFARRKRLLLRKKKWRTFFSDRLSQFKAMGGLRHVKPASTAFDVSAKQVTQLYVMVEAYNAGEDISIKDWREVIYDIQNYLDLALACMEEEI